LLAKINPNGHYNEKLEFIKEVLHLSNEKIIDKLNDVLKKEKKHHSSPKKSVKDFYGIMDDSEGSEFKATIEEGCEKTILSLS
jgi:hypothetical protein